MDYEKIYAVAEKAFCTEAKLNMKPKGLEETAAPFVKAIIAALKEQEEQSKE